MTSNLPFDFRWESIEFEENWTSQDTELQQIGRMVWGPQRCRCGGLGAQQLCDGRQFVRETFLVSWSNQSQCCRIPPQLRHQWQLFSQRVRIFARPKIHFLEIRGKSLPLQNSTGGWFRLLCHCRVQVSNFGGIGASPFHACGWTDYSTPVPST